MWIRKEVIIPPAGETQEVQIEGCGVVVEAVNDYEFPADWPLIGFDGYGETSPMYPGASIVSQGGKQFGRIVIRGTDASAGDTVSLLVSDVAIEQDIVVPPQSQRKRRAGVSFKVAGSDAVQELNVLSLEDGNGNLPTRIYISCLDADIRYAFNADPEQGAGGLGTVLTASSDPVTIEGVQFITGFRFIASVATETPTLTVHLEY